MEEQWGFEIHEFGFSNFSPTPETLEITQLQKLAEEKLGLYLLLRSKGLTEQAAVSLVSGAVVAWPPAPLPAAPPVDGDGKSAAVASATGATAADAANVSA